MGLGEDGWDIESVSDPNIASVISLCHDVQLDTNTMVFETLSHVKNLVSTSHGPEYGDNVVLTGGVALNSVTNGLLKTDPSSPFSNVYIPPFTGDEGVAFGAAVKAAIDEYGGEEKGRILREVLEGFEPYTGTVYGEEEIMEAIEEVRRRKGNIRGIQRTGGRFIHLTQIDVSLPPPLSLLFITQFEGFINVENFTGLSDDLVTFAASRIASGEVIAWYQGGSEVGPRALGHRSILGDPRDGRMVEFINKKIKVRENFRPFAPSVLKEYVSEVSIIQEGTTNVLSALAVVRIIQEGTTNVLSALAN